jgi:hypothetical protein
VTDSDRVDDFEQRVTHCVQRAGQALGHECEDDEPCELGICRQETLGKLCVDEVPCRADGHCSLGFCALPGDRLLAAQNGGVCTDGISGSACFGDFDCRWGCEGGSDLGPGTCTDGSAGGPCSSASACRSTRCDDTGACAEAQYGDACSADGQWASGCAFTSAFKISAVRTATAAASSRAS